MSGSYLDGLERLDKGADGSGKAFEEHKLAIDFELGWDGLDALWGPDGRDEDASSVCRLQEGDEQWRR